MRSAAAVVVAFGWIGLLIQSNAEAFECVYSCVNITCFINKFDICVTWELDQGGCMANTSAGLSQHFKDVPGGMNWYNSSEEEVCERICVGTGRGAATGCPAFSSTGAMLATKAQCTANENDPSCY